MIPKTRIDNDADMEMAERACTHAWKFLRRHEHALRAKRERLPRGSLVRIALDLVLLEIDLREELERSRTCPFSPRA